VYYGIREAMDLTVYETIGFGYILARANGKLNYRRVLGFRVLGPGTSKRCGFRIVKRLKDKKTWLEPLHKYHVPKAELTCDRRAVVGVLMEIHDKKFMIYLCPVHFKKFLDNMVEYVRERAERAYSLVMEEAESRNPLWGLEDIGLFFSEEKED